MTELGKVLFVLSEWGFWGEELIGSLEELRRAGYTVEFATPTGRRPKALPPSMSPEYEDPPLGKSVTSAEMADAVKKINDPANTTLASPHSLKYWFPERPYWSEKEELIYKDENGESQKINSPMRKWEAYYRLRDEAQAKATGEFIAILLVGGSGPMVDMVNNFRVHDLILGFVASNLEGVSAALAAGADVEQRWPCIGTLYDGYTPLLIAALKGNEAILMELIAHKADPNAVEPVFGAVPLHKGTYNGHLGVVRQLIAVPGVNLDYQGPSNGYTPLHDALWHGFAECAWALVKAGARTDIVAYDSMLPVDIAAADLGPDHALTMFLRDRGADGAAR